MTRGFGAAKPPQYEVSIHGTGIRLTSSVKHLSILNADDQVAASRSEIRQRGSSAAALGAISGLDFSRNSSTQHSGRTLSISLWKGLFLAESSA